jgi:hypothetical protein
MMTADSAAAFAAYETARKAYWDAQEVFRVAAIQRIRDLIPDTHAGVLLEINDTPRLSLFAPILLDDSIDDDADVYDMNDDTWGEIDGVANDMEAGTWDEAESFLQSPPLEAHGDERFVVWKDPNR